MSRYLLSLPIVLLTLICLSCRSTEAHPKSLTRSNAAELIASNPSFRTCQECTYTLRLDGWNQGRWGGRPAEWQEDDRFPGYKPSSAEELLRREPMVHWLYTSGYVQVSPEVSEVDVRMMDGSTRKEKVRAGLTLTEKGKIASKEWQQVSMPPGSESQQWVIPLATRKLVDVTGIASEPMMGENLKEVQYTFVYAPTRLGSELFGNNGVPSMDGRSIIPPAVIVQFDSKQTYRRTAMLRLYDDGWRLEH